MSVKAMHASHSLSECAVLWHLHAPKTAGSTLMQAMGSLTGTWLAKPGDAKGEWTWYIHHGAGFPVDDCAARIDRAVSTPEHRLLVSSETPLYDLLRMPALRRRMEHICFVSVVREPGAWLKSALIHLCAAGAGTAASGYRAGIACLHRVWGRREGYLDQHDLQYWQVHEDFLSRPRPYKLLALTTIESAASLLAPLADSARKAAHLKAALDLSHNSCQERGRAVARHAHSSVSWCATASSVLDQLLAPGAEFALQALA